ncbi:MAG: hypothetical protein COV60_03045 [Candidatus Magasanikbacteria bacterium CG11_big_fil_rev_8_21_14_0_20_43_7]|uniref:MobA-like NTP transferase domain-containing protein n=1 Tax=Candidatus Magasanikbacteria bacterium CG11_big_fil_rev_8_21_14_0_20_43_7 TaxID=1974654 RepID=A0A2H0N227_9BACT|nr:MAG: hypothetical protein COV60_03045 [Candidatus Magasanikbacteria bacterium CG11_big_fil_rev_8_21_14_0_20_43_7]
MIDNTVGVVILAAGHGTRMKSEIPKVMHELNGKPLVGHVVDNAIASGITQKPVVVVSSAGTLVRAYFGDRVEYAVQEKQLGTGHATAAATKVVSKDAEHIVVLYGDMPMLRPESIQRLVHRHIERDNTVTVMTVTVPSFEAPYTPFFGFGRIVRNQRTGHIEQIVEKKDCTDVQLEIKELNTSFFSFKADWLWSHITKLQNTNAQQEYYLVDLLKLAIDEGQRVSAVATDPHEAMGINSPEDFQVAEQAMSLRND